MPTHRTRDAEATKDAILQAAEKVFAEKGFAGTTLRELSEASGASGPLIVFHFKDKQGVHEGVKATIIRRFFAAWNATPLPEKSFDCFIEHVLRAMFRFYRENPTMIRLANWGRLEGDIDSWPGEEEWHHACWECIRQAQERGEIREDLTPLNVSIMFCGTVHIWWEHHAHFLKHMSAGMDEHKADDFYLRQCLSFLRQGLSKPDAANTNETPLSSTLTGKGKRHAKRTAKD